MSFVQLLSLLLFTVFLVSYISKLVIMHRMFGIEALVLAKGEKGKSVDTTETVARISTFIWGAFWLLESVFHHLIVGFLPNFFTSQNVQYVGLFVILSGLVFFISSMITMKNSWRVGIDKNTKTELITNGLYKYSRNPAFVGFDLMFIGLFLTFPNIVTIFICFINILAIHSLILQEEKHLEGMLKEDYVVYRKQTPRYLFL